MGRCNGGVGCYIGDWWWVVGHLNRFCPSVGRWVRIGLAATATNTISQTPQLPSSLLYVLLVVILIGIGKIKTTE